jgi:hypothetical protein
MPQLGFEPTIPVSGREKTVHALDRAATMIGTYANHYHGLLTRFYLSHSDPIPLVSELSNAPLQKLKLRQCV